MNANALPNFSNYSLGLDSKHLYGTSTKEQRLQCFTQVKTLLTPQILVLDDECILRFLKAREFDLQKSIEMIKLQRCLLPT